MSKMYERLSQFYTMPFPPLEHQKQAFDEHMQWDKSALYHDVGTGKTYTLTGLIFLWGLTEEIKQAIIVVPPSLLYQWKAWLDKVAELNPGLTSELYMGTPARRKTIDLTADILIMSMGIFKQDYQRLSTFFKNRKVLLAVDEAQMVRNITTQNHRRVRDFAADRHLVLMTATPIDKPLQCFGFIKLVTPGIYRSLKQFKNLHVEEEDFWGVPTKYMNQDLLRENLMLQATQVNAEDVLDLPEIQYIPIPYELEPKHYRLYKELMDEKLLILKDKVIDATQATSLYHQSQQLIMSPQAYCDTEIVPTGYGVLGDCLMEAGNEKVIIFSNYRLTNESVFAYVEKLGWNPVLCYGGVGSGKINERVQKFLHDPECRALVGSPLSIGIGTNLQSACRYVLFMEMPITPSVFKQSVGRVHRQGQKRRCIVKIAVALNTIQVRIQKNVVNNDELVQEVFDTPKKMRDAIYGV